ncbi:MAG TPA: flagellar hook basal-body protein [Vitreimonas sp.]|uniref:flagellar hook-basal body protein n=1 Tax=Vitreimonas sp. TaxID=3069702 RepID=UPI002D4A866C|nr:flagellar hook basal-body protein [Vitreimonas sp.]HYD85979.1 flagellar hook basal-body protein [Vitreimonas sp.]
MQGLLELGEIMLSASQRRLDAVSRNVANVSTPGFKRSAAFDVRLADAAGGAAASTYAATDFAQGALRLTGRPLDLALTGGAFFQVRVGERIYFTRSGAFERDADGRIVDAQGLALQSVSGRDIVIGAGPIEILADGVVLEAGRPIDRIALFEPGEPTLLRRSSGALFESPDGAMRLSDAEELRQGMLESANVDMAKEMLDMMSAVRAAEAGARIVQAYDTLIGQSISTFGRGSR